MLSALSWNIHGNILLKPVDDGLWKYLEEFNIIMLQETHLLPKAEDTRSYDVYTTIRPAADDMYSQGGRVIALVRSALPSQQPQEYPTCSAWWRWLGVRSSMSSTTPRLSQRHSTPDG